MAPIAQSAEHRFCKPAVMSSSLIASSAGKSVANMEGCPSGQREQTVNLPAYAYGGSNPPPSTRRTRGDICGCSSVGRASVFQTECRRFEPGRPLYKFRLCPGSSVVEHPLGKGEVVSSNLILGSEELASSSNLTQKNDEAGNERWLKKSLSGTNHTST